jgi:2-polyprenyl-3-methyl-5-hydroxy-6-metoxy-1,4-benzoquinol methylase
MNIPELADKKIYFDQYWREQPAAIADPRAVQRAEIVYHLLNRSEGRLLDLGCGRGAALGYFARLGFDVIGADISPEMIVFNETRGHKAIFLDLEKDDMPTGFDIVLCLEVLQQLYDPAAFIDRIKNSLSDSSVLAVSFPNEFHIVSRLRLLFGRSHLGHFEHSHIRLFSPGRGRELLQKTGWNILRTWHIPIIPPKWKFLSALFSPLAQFCPSLFALSSIYILRKP